MNSTITTSFAIISPSCSFFSSSSFLLLVCLLLRPRRLLRRPQAPAGLAGSPRKVRQGAGAGKDIVYRRENPRLFRPRVAGCPGVGPQPRVTARAANGRHVRFL